ncbi:hypothetical protein KKD81_00595 [Patescibacteria group bacterium]|nr:hypothetical protein [Patescibacteria group bacterium]MBU2158813.1 hypothetical protein [Patescibacteria group bacterium]MBU2220417.1 hypothetical protein [Patescibacteria group bacterium]
MATIVNNPNSDSGGGAGGWIVAGVLIIAVVLIAIFVWPGFANQGGSPAPTQVNVEIPTPDVGGGEGAPAQ